MRHVSFADRPCSLAQSLEVVGEWWTLVILQELFFGSHRFGQLQERLGIAKNVLSERLEHLISHGVISRETLSPGGRRTFYRLTKKGQGLATDIIALIQWGDTWIMGQEHAPLNLVERKSGEQIASLQLQARDGSVLSLADIEPRPGPGANEQLRARFSYPVNQASNIRWRVQPRANRS